MATGVTGKATEKMSTGIHLYYLETVVAGKS